MSEPTISNIISTMSVAIFNVLQPTYMPQPNKEKWKQIAIEYNDYRQMPHCIGSIDGKHIRLQKPKLSGSLYYNYKNFYSLILMASVDANYTFTIIDVGAVGSANDTAVFRNSTFGKKFYNNELDIPKADALTDDGEKIPYFFIADEAFPLGPNLMRPFSGTNISSVAGDRERKDIFNYRLSRGRLNVECAFGMMRSKFRVLDTPLKTNVKNSVRIIKAICALHNYIRIEDRPHINETEIAMNFRESRLLMQTFQDLCPQQTGRGNQSYDGLIIRDYLSTHFLSETGQVPWQTTRINPTNFN